MASSISTEETPEQHAYGTHASQYLLLYRGDSSSNKPPILIIHGGFWKSKFTISTSGIATAVLSLRNLGHAIGVVEYRRSEEPGWEYPGAQNDVQSAFELFRHLLNSPPSSVIIIGHSAGGAMALILSATATSPEKTPRLTVAIAPVADMCEAARRKLSDKGDAIQKYMGGEPWEQDRLKIYKRACPMCRAEEMQGKKILLVIGTNDEHVPCCMARSLNERLDTGDKSMCELLEIKGMNHMQLVDAASEAWQKITLVIESLVSGASVEPQVMGELS